MFVFHLRCTIFCILFLLAFGPSTTPLHAQGKDGGKVDGAIWSFQMIPKDKNLEKRVGLFRMEVNVIYQKSDLSKPDFDKKIGAKTEYKAARNKRGKIVGEEKTELTFFDLQSNTGKYTGMKGKAFLKKNRLGEWEGRFVDGEGQNWDFKTSRKQE